MSGKFKFACAFLVMLLAAMTAPTFAQNGGGGGGNGGGGGGGRGGFNPQQMWDGIKADMGATDDEFAAIQPKIQKVMGDQRDAMGGGMFGRGRRGGGGGGGGAAGGNQPTSAVQTASDELKKTLDNKDSTPDDIKSKVQALRDAKKAAKETLTKDQEDLKSVLTARQEAVLVQRGMLD